MTRQFTLAKADAVNTIRNRIVDDRPTLLASQESYQAGDIIVTLAEGFSFQVVENGGHLTTAGGVALQVLPRGAAGGGMYPAAAFGNDAAAAQAAFDAAVADSSASGVVFRGDWQIDQTVTVSDPHNIRVDARAAAFRTDVDILMFDINGRADPTYTDNESRQNFHWEGGRFGCTVTDPVHATAMRVLGMRNASVEIEDIGLTYGGFATGIVTGGKDTIYIRGTKFYDTLRCVEIPPWSAIGGPITIVLEKLHGSIGNGEQLVRSWMPLCDSVIRDCSLNMGSGAAQRGIEVARFVCVGVPTTFGTFQIGETVQGGTSGATARFVEIYEHTPFALGGHTTWLVMEERAGTFLAGETLSGLSSGASAAIPAEAGYLVQNLEWSNFRICGSMHIEAGSGANGATAVSLLDREGVGRGPVYWDLDLGSCGVNGGGAVGLEIGRVGNVRISGRFAQTAGDGTPIRFAAQTGDVTIVPGTRFSSGAIDLNGMDRAELNLSAFDTRFPRPVILNGWNSKSLSTTTATQLDMAADFPSYATVAGLAPRAYSLGANVRDSGSQSAAGPSRPRFRMHHPEVGTAAQFCDLTFSGAPDDEWRGGEFLVGADDTGAIAYDCLSTGTGTLDVNLRVTGMFF